MSQGFSLIGNQMTQSEYDRIANELLAEAKAIEEAKRPGYTLGSEDVLANFKRVAERSNLTPGQVWNVYALKHMDSISSIMTKPGLPVSEAPLGRFADMINYIRLGYALYLETFNDRPTATDEGTLPLPY